MPFTVYMLQLRDNTIYTGYTKNLEKRLELHSKGTGSKYVRARLPHTLSYVEKFETRSDAMRREIKIKKMSRKKKLDMIHTYQNNQNE